MHETYTTAGFVLKARPYKEDSVEAVIFTETLGKVRVIAQAAKRAGATFAACTEPGTYGMYAFIKGRYSWRLTGRHDLIQYTYLLEGKRKKVYLKALSLLARLLPEHEAQPGVYTKLKELVERKEENNFEREEAEMAFEILCALGYADKSIDTKDTKSLILEVNKGIFAAGL